MVFSIYAKIISWNRPRRNLGQALDILRKFPEIVTSTSNAEKIPARSAGKNLHVFFQRKIQENHRNHWSGQKKMVRNPENPVSGLLRRPNTAIKAGPFFAQTIFFA